MEEEKLTSQARRRLERKALNSAMYKCKRCGKWFSEKDFVIEKGLCKKCFFKEYGYNYK